MIGWQTISKREVTVDDSYSLLKRRSRLDPENILSLQLLKRRLGFFPVHILYLTRVGAYQSRTSNVTLMAYLYALYRWCRTRTLTNNGLFQSTFSHSRDNYDNYDYYDISDHYMTESLVGMYNKRKTTSQCGNILPALTSTTE